MALKIRLARAGTKKRPHYNIVIADSRSPRDGRFIEKIGFYNPLLPKDHADRIKLDLEKSKAWIAKGATASDRVHRFLANAGVASRRNVEEMILQGRVAVNGRVMTELPILINPEKDKVTPQPTIGVQTKPEWLRIWGQLRESPALESSDENDSRQE